MNFAQEVSKQQAHYTKFAQLPGWYQHSRDQVHFWDSEDSGLFKGLRAVVAKNLADAGFVPAPDERGEWWK